LKYQNLKKEKKRRKKKKKASGWILSDFLSLTKVLPKIKIRIIEKEVVVEFFNLQRKRE
jgi:hypothetical protein